MENPGGFALKCAVSLMYLLWVLAVFNTIRTSKMARQRKPFYIIEHRQSADTALVLTVLLIPMVEALRLAATGPRMGGFGLVFWIHLAAAITVTASMIAMRFAYNGQQYRQQHTFIARWLLSWSFTVTALTGPFLIYEA